MIRHLVVGFALVGLLALAAAALGRTSSDVADLLPHGEPHLDRVTAFFADQGAVRLIALTAESATDPAAARRELLDLVPRLAAFGATPMASPGVGGVAHAAAVAESHLAALADPADLAAALTPTALDQRLAALRLRLNRPEDTMSATAAARDPLGLAYKPLASLSTGPAGASADGPLFRHPDGQAWMIPLQIAFAPDDLDQAKPLVAAIETAIAAAAQRGVHLGAAGPYRHYVANQRTIFNDLILTLPLSFVAAALLLWSLLGRWRSLLAAQVPPLLGLLGALAGAGAWSLATGHRIPLAMFGFAAGILGIAVDYGTHVAAHGRLAVPRRELALGYLTTGAAFLVLFASAVPALQALGAMVVVGLGVALLASLLLIPRWVPDLPTPSPWRHVATPLGAWIERQPWRRVGLAALLTVGLAPGLAGLRWETDLRRFDGSGAAVWRDLDAFLLRWGPPDASTFLVSPAADLDTALVQAATARRELGLPPSAVERLLPDRATQAERRSAWNRTLAEHADWTADFATAAQAHGLRARGFSLSLYAPTDPAATPLMLTDWQATPVAQMLTQVVRPTASGWVVATPMPGIDARAAAALTARLASGPVWIANRSDLGHELMGAVRGDLIRLGGFIALAMLVVVALGERRWRSTVAILLAPALALVWTGGIMGWAGIALSPFALLAAALVAGVGIDAAIFCARGVDPVRLAPVLACTATTLAGLGSLILANHPVVRGMGQILSLGMVAALVAALLIVPALARPTKAGHSQP